MITKILEFLNLMPKTPPPPTLDLDFAVLTIKTYLNTRSTKSRQFSMQEIRNECSFSWDDMKQIIEHLKTTNQVTTFTEAECPSCGHREPVAQVADFKTCPKCKIQNLAPDIVDSYTSYEFKFK